MWNHDNQIYTDSKFTHNSHFKKQLFSFKEFDLSWQRVDAML